MGEIAILTKEHLAWRRSQGGDGGSGGIWGMGMATLWVLSWFYHGFLSWFLSCVYLWFLSCSICCWLICWFICWLIWWRMVNMVQLNSREETCLGIITRWSSWKKLWQVSCTARIAAISSPGSGGLQDHQRQKHNKAGCEADDAMSWDGSLQPQSIKSTAMECSVKRHK